ncbi:hypothetical protein [Gimesia algae]|uniref:Uncharacterized protein n=1 Tax=Gimesia algae TaxID=2527971 RepID=A0A517VF60_9PLAN|nr:hypothetical protein [Gimesia algae]QDT91626.1 hypothetical protein Pan161_32880 [Gimesia algae]
MKPRSICELNYTDIAVEESGDKLIIDGSLDASGWSSGVRSEMVNISETLGSHVATYQGVPFQTSCFYAIAETDVCVPQSSEQQQVVVVDDITEKGARPLVTDYIKPSVETIATEKSESLNYSTLLGIFEYQQKQYQSASEESTRRHRFNMRILIGIISFVLLVITISVASATNYVTDLNILLIQSLPRLTLVSVAVFFAGFFMKSCRSDSADIKYYQNELTNLKSHQIALVTTIGYGNSESIQNIIAAFTNTDRNQIKESAPFKNHA